MKKRKKNTPSSTAEVDSEKIHEVLHEFKEGKLRMGKSRKRVKKRKQAIAIALSEARKKEETKE